MFDGKLRQPVAIPQRTSFGLIFVEQKIKTVIEAQMLAFIIILHNTPNPSRNIVFATFALELKGDALSNCTIGQWRSFNTNFKRRREIDDFSIKGWFTI